MAKTWDNYDYFELEDMRQAQREARLPHCDICDEPMTEWVEIPQKFGNLNVCEHCIRMNWKYYEED